MDNRFISTAIIVVVIIASMGCVIAYDNTLNKDSDSGVQYNVIARVNSDGSGIYVHDSYLNSKGIADISVMYDVTLPGVYSVNSSVAQYWAGAVVGTPGAATIQHVQMQQLAEAMGLAFELYQDGVSDRNSTTKMFYIAGLANSNAILNNAIAPDMGCIWEPQFTNVVADDHYDTIGLTNNFFPGHTCCILLGDSSYMNSHPVVTEKFLLGYARGVDYINNAIADPSSPEYIHMLGVAEAKTGIHNKNVLMDAISHIDYLYADPTDDLSKLRMDLSELASTLPGINHSIKDLGFVNDYQFGQAFVDDSYLIEAIKEKNGSPEALEWRTSISVACIAGDIHQLALHIAIDQGYFDALNLNVVVSSATNGPGVATSIQNGEASFGFLGAPPATSMVMNGEYVRA